MVAGGEGWTILTPLALHHAARFQAAVEVLPLPMDPISRTLSLSARSGVLQDMPGQIAARLRGLIGDMVVGPMVQRMPWAKGELRVL